MKLSDVDRVRSGLSWLPLVRMGLVFAGAMLSPLAGAGLFYVPSNAPTSRVSTFGENGAFIAHVVTSANGLADPTDLEPDAAGNLYIASQDTGRILKLAPNGTISTVALTPDLLRLAIAPNGTLYYTRTGSVGFGSIYRVNADGTSTPLGSGLGRPTDIEFHPLTGEMYYSDSINGSGIWRFDLATQTRTHFANVGASAAAGIEFDAGGLLYAALFFEDTVLRIAGDGTSTVFATTGLAGPADIGFDPNGNVYIANADPGADNVRKFAPVGTDLGPFITTDIFRPSTVVFLQQPAAAVTEPATFSLFLTALLAWGALRRRRPI